jgi:hypothetical protein
MLVDQSNALEAVGCRNAREAGFRSIGDWI